RRRSTSGSTSSHPARAISSPRKRAVVGEELFTQLFPTSSLDRGASPLPHHQPEILVGDELGDSATKERRGVGWVQPAVVAVAHEVHGPTRRRCHHRDAGRQCLLNGLAEG